jgi:hypothetical protein
MESVVIEIAGIITALVGVLTAMGGGMKFVWIKIEARIKALDGKIDTMQTELDQCHAKHERSLERRAVQLTVIELLWQEVERISPGSAVLLRGKKLLDELKPKEGD